MSAKNFAKTNPQQPARLNVKQPFNPSDDQLESPQSRILKKLFGFLYIYAILIVSLYVTYAVYYYFQQESVWRQSHRDAAQVGASHLKITQRHTEDAQESTKLELKLQLLERYVEVIAMDLQETKNKLREREKCDCTMSCSFNGTKYADQSSWQNQCDTCTCQNGRISCLPRTCPTLTCEDQVTLPGHCCPICMRKCKYNNSFIRHGQKFNPLEAKSQSKQCKCYDGRIKCEAILSPKRSSTTTSTTTTKSPDKKSTTFGELNAEPISSDDIARAKRDSRQVISMLRPVNSRIVV